MFGWSRLLQDVPETPVVQSPLPGGVATFVRFVFGLPQWVQVLGALIAALIAAAIGFLLWTRRRRIAAWITSRSRRAQLAIAASALAAVLGVTFAALASWNYIQHENAFCTGCHVMLPAFQRFQTSEHAALRCHDCHRQSIFASARQLYFWIAERPEEIPPHGKVPTGICAECHIREQPAEVWQRISATAGHRVHLESTASALANVQCVTCHGVEVHRFVPVDETCGQSGCHAGIDITLGRMAGQTGFHCVACHPFTAPVAEHTATDSATKRLTPGVNECLACHAMQATLAGFDRTTEPHGARCGDCHNPHEQTTPSEAFQTCERAGCHATPQVLTPFHRGITASVLSDCGRCHESHDWTVEGIECTICHTRPPPDPRVDAATSAVLASRLQDPFRHETHRSVACIDCHTSREAHGSLAVKTPADCMACHHDPARTPNCTACHGARTLTSAYPRATTMRLSIWDAPRERTLAFDHRDHPALACARCHATPLTLAVTTACTDCHSDHHRPETDCAGCHTRPPTTAHTVDVHTQGCAGSGCHGPAGPARLVTTRGFCLGCHQDQRRHQVGKNCADCHLVAGAAGG